MAIRLGKETFESSYKKQINTMNNQFEIRLAEIGISEEQILKQNIEELENSLELINDALNKPESFGEIHLKASAQLPLVVSSQAESQIKVGIVPLLLKRKQLILERIKQFKESQGVESLKSMVNSIQEDELKEKIDNKIEEILNSSKVQSEETRKIESERLQAEIESQERLQKLEIEMMEKKANIKQSYFSKDSLASLLGGILLISLAICLIIAMFTEVKSTEILNNAFLIILGYFFGQSVVKTTGNNGDN